MENIEEHVSEEIQEMIVDEYIRRLLADEPLPDNGYFPSDYLDDPQDSKGTNLSPINKNHKGDSLLGTRDALMETVKLPILSDIQGRMFTSPFMKSDKERHDLTIPGLDGVFTIEGGKLRQLLLDYEGQKSVGKFGKGVVVFYANVPRQILLDNCSKTA